MTLEYAENFRARWADMDFNQHMKNSAFLACSEDTRMRFLDANGWTMADFMSRQIGPVILEDKLTYKRELKLLDRFRVTMELAAITADARRMKLRNTFFTEDGTLSAVVESVLLWFDLKARKPVVPPDELKKIWLDLVRTPDFVAW